MYVNRPPTGKNGGYEIPRNLGRNGELPREKNPEDAYENAEPRIGNYPRGKKPKEDKVEEEDPRYENPQPMPNVQKKTAPKTQVKPVKKRFEEELQRDSAPKIQEKSIKIGLKEKIVAGALATIIFLLLLIIILSSANLGKNLCGDGKPTTEPQVGTKPSESTTSTAAPTTPCPIVPTPTCPTSPIPFDNATSCLNLRARGVTTDGIYALKTDDLVGQIFCDMTTGGGGWTLVASVHEANISDKCGADDHWSRYTDGNRQGGGHTAWENEVSFGNVYRSTSGDYKNSFYSSLNASDVMVWHVTSGTATNDTKATAKLRYRTTNGFLQGQGGNLRNLFQGNPLQIVSGDRAGLVLDELVKNATRLKAQVPDWFEYSIATVSILHKPYSLSGSHITFRSSSCDTGLLTYEKKSKCWTSNSFIDSRKSQPFMAVSVISNEERTEAYFELESRSFISLNTTNKDGSPYLQNRLTKGNYKLHYRLLQYHTPSNPTASEYNFVVANVNQWRSVEPTSYTLSQTYPGNTQARVDGSPSNIIMGYMLLSRQNGTKVTEAQADAVGNTILDVIASMTNLFNEFPGEKAIVTPVIFDKGDNNIAMNVVPPKYRTMVEPGFLQFRAYNLTGYPNAMCPGVKVKSGSPEYICIGGLSSEIGDHGTCGDFAGWEGKTKNDVAFGHSTEDLSTTILIFYR